MAKKKEEIGISADLRAAMNALNKTYGEGSVIAINEAPNVSIERIGTGSFILDHILEGGYPKRKVIEIFGDESIGKSTLAWHFLSQFSGPKLYIDTEQSLDKEYGERIGVDLNNTIITQPSTIEEGLDILQTLIDKVDAIVFDSIAEAATKKELEGELTDQDIGVKAKLMSKAFRKLKATEHNATIMFINQVRQNPGVVYGSPRVVPGGNAVKFGAHLRIDLYGKEAIKKGEEIIGHYMNLKIVKSKISTPHIKCQIPLIYDGRGISREQEVIDLCIEKGIIEKSGSWLKYNGANLAQGLENARTFLIDNPELREELEQKLKA